MPRINLKLPRKKKITQKRKFTQYMQSSHSQIFQQEGGIDHVHYCKTLSE